MAMTQEVVNEHARRFTLDLAHFEKACVHDSASISRPIFIKFGK